MSTSRQIELKTISEQQNPLIEKKLPQNHDDEATIHSDDHINRPSIRGPYRPIRNGNIKGSIFAMLASALGTGCLNLPFRASQLGLIPFIITTLLAAALSYFGMYLMERIIIKYKVPSYSQMVRKAFGQRIMRYSQFILILFPWGFSICLQVIFTKFVLQVLYDVIGLPLYQDRQREIYNTLGNLVRIVVSVLNIIFNMKHFFLTDLSEMLHTLGKFSVTGVVISMGFIVMTAFTGFSKTVGDKEVQYSSIFTMNYEFVAVMPQVNSRYISILLQGLSGIFFTFLNHQFIFPLISHLKRPSKSRVDRIFVYAHVEQIIIYLLIGILGYVLLSQHVDFIPISPLVVTSIPTFPLLLGKILIAASLFFNLPLQIFAAREYLYEALSLDRNQANMRHINMVYISSSFLIGLLFQGVSSYFGLIGGTVGVMMASGIPLACFYKLITINIKDMMIMAFMVILSILCFLGAMQSIFNPL